MEKTSESKQTGPGIAVSGRLTWSGIAGRSTVVCIVFRRLDVALCRLLSCPWPDQKSWRCTAQIVPLDVVGPERTSAGGALVVLMHLAGLRQCHGE